MKLTPFVNAGIAASYICAIVLCIQALSAVPATGDTIVAPLLMLPLLVFSVALMALLFFYEPVRLLLAGKAEEALRFFLATLAIFAVLAILIVLAAALAFAR